MKSRIERMEKEVNVTERTRRREVEKEKRVSRKYSPSEGGREEVRDRGDGREENIRIELLDRQGKVR